MSRPSDSTGAPAGVPALTVEASEPLSFGQPVLGRHVDRPALGPIEGDLSISGWALCGDAPHAHVLAIAGNAPALHVRADRSRPDIGAAFPDVPHAEQSGFRLLVPAAVAARIDGEIAIAIELIDGRRVPIWRLSISRATAAAEQPVAQEQRARWRWARRRVATPATSSEDSAAKHSAFAGSTTPDGPRPATGPLSVDRPGPATVLEDHFRVIALIATFNEADIIEPVLDHLASNGVWSYLIDNCSTDETVSRAQRWLGRGLLGIERFSNPANGRTSWGTLLARKVELARELGGDWYIHHDADEIRESPWPGTTLREAIHCADRLGYNAIDFRVVSFAPVDDAFRAGDDPRRHFLLWEEPADYDRLQRKCWKAGAADVALAEGGHDVRFADRRVFPMRFLLRHYPIRSQAHGLRKVFEDRKSRFAEDELALGWHRQYDHIARPDHLFLRNPALLRKFDLDEIRLETMLEDGRAGETAASRAMAGEAVGGGTAARERPQGGHGVLDHVSPARISGWATLDDGSGEPALVKLWDGGRPLATVTAKEPRPDLHEHGVEEGGGFALATPRELLDGRPHWIWATVAGSGAALGGSPSVLHAAGRLSLTAGGGPAATSDTP